MNKDKIITLAAMVVALAGCSNDTVAPDLHDSIELRFSSAINAGNTRSSYSATQSTALAAGQTVYAWVDDKGDAAATPAIPASEHIMAWTLVCQADASLSGTNKYYYPASGRTVNVYAIHGNFATAPVEGTTSWTDVTTITHQVLSAQHAAGNYELSDFLFARNVNIPRDNSIKPLNFKHQLSKIEIHLVCGNGLTAGDFNGATVKIKNIKPVADLTLSKTLDDVTVTPSGTPVDIECRMQYLPDVQRNVSDDPLAPDMRNAYAYAEAIVVPQWFSSDGTSSGAAQQFLEITLANGLVLTNMLGPVQFEQGKKYDYNVTVNSTELMLKCVIDDWIDGTAAPINTSAD